MLNIHKSARLISSRVLTASFFIPNVLIPLGVVSFYFVASSWLLPEGVNRAFVAGSEKYVLPITAFLGIALFAAGGFRGPHHQGIRSSKESFAGDLLLLLLPLTPVMQYIVNNDDILPLPEAILLFCSFALFAALPILVIPLLFRNSGSLRPLMSVGLAFAFSITNMASLSHQFSWYGVGTPGIQLAVFGIVWFVSWLLFHLNYRNLLHLLAAVYFVGNLIVQLNGQNGKSSIANLDETDNRLVMLIGSGQPVVTPDIYLLIYDAYVVNETMLSYGIDNQIQEQYLEDLGFRIYPHTYSVDGGTVGTMSRVLNASVDYYGIARRGVSGDGVAQNLLQGFGYKTYGVFPSDFFFRGTIPRYDYSFPGYGSSANVLLEAIFVGEFRFDIGFDKVSREQYVEEKRHVFSEASEAPKFIYTHSDEPAHSQNSGTCLPNEVELYAERLAGANLEMRQDIEMIIENDPAAIVIVAGDHGPYLTKNCFHTGDVYDISEITRLDLQDRFGTFLAIRWPTEDFAHYDDITVLQDLFPVVFAYMFEDPELLEAKIKPVTLDYERASGAGIIDGGIRGGIDHGEPLFTGGDE